MASRPPAAKTGSDEVLRYRKQMSGGGPIKVMTVGLLGLTTWFAYDLYMKKRFPHQHGVRCAPRTQTLSRASWTLASSQELAPL